MSEKNINGYIEYYIKTQEDTENTHIRYGIVEAIQKHDSEISCNYVYAYNFNNTGHDKLYLEFSTNKDFPSSKYLDDLLLTSLNKHVQVGDSTKFFELLISYTIEEKNKEIDCEYIVSVRTNYNALVSPLYGSLTREERRK